MIWTDANLHINHTVQAKTPLRNSSDIRMAKNCFWHKMLLSDNIVFVKKFFLYILTSLLNSVTLLMLPHTTLIALNVTASLVCNSNVCSVNV